MGRERLIGENKLDKVGQPKRILVVGAGPDGMEAARAAALRGHRVILAEARSKLSATLNLLRAVPGLQGLCGLIDWQREKIDRLGVKAHTNTSIEAEELLHRASVSTGQALGEDCPGPRRCGPL